MKKSFPKIVLVHDWLVTMRGGERVLQALHRLWPDAPIHTLIVSLGRLPDDLRQARIRPSFLQNLPWVDRYHRWLLPLYPWALRRLRLESADLVVSISHSFAHGVACNGLSRHLCYCLTPMRYAWVYPEIYFSGWPARMARGWLVRSLRAWDLSAIRSVDEVVVISKTIQDRVARFWGRSAEVIHPPVEVDRFRQMPRNPSDFYLVVSALVPYKRVDLAIEACRRLNRKLVVIGDGPLRRRLQRQAGSNATFLGWCSHHTLQKAYAQARALLYPQEEDFGIAAVEAQAAGCPVVAYRSGGALETVRDKETGVFFFPQTVEAMIDAMERLERMRFDPEVLLQQASRFDQTIFKQRFLQKVEGVLNRPKTSHAG